MNCVLAEHKDTYVLLSSELCKHMHVMVVIPNTSLQINQERELPSSEFHKIKDTLDKVSATCLIILVDIILIMVLSSASLCSLLLLGVVCCLTAASPDLNAIDQAKVAAPRYESPLTQVTIQRNCCRCCPSGSWPPNYYPYCVHCTLCPICDKYKEIHY